MYNAIANGGKMMRPYLVNAIRQDGNDIKSFMPVVVSDNICGVQTLAQLRDILEGVVSEGTAKEIFKGAPYKAAGKTGTAQVAEGSRGYIDHKYQSSFAGYFPAENPVFSCIVLIKNKQYAAKYYGGLVAAPVFKEVADKLYATYIQGKTSVGPALGIDSAAFAYAGLGKDIRQVYRGLGVPYTDSNSQGSWVSILSNSNYRPVLYNRAVSKQKMMPELKGMGLKDILYLLENMGMKVTVNGRGKAIAQSLPAGTALTKGQTIYVTLN
jgi:cell division protein FtsI (penicillin-binding protein 3)